MLLMKFAAPYQLEFDCPINYEDIDEFNIYFTKYSSFEELKKFVEKYPSHQINVSFTDDDYDIEKIAELCDEFKNIFIRLSLRDFKYLYFFDDNNINYIFDYTIPIYNYSLLEWALSHKVKGIYISDDLTYNLQEVYNQCFKNGIKLRVLLNRVPVTNFLSLTCPTVQVYQPQNYNFLSQYYDVGEFFYEDNYDWGKVKILYQKWFIEHDWDDDLELINSNLVLPYPTKSIPPELTRLRSVCQHRCTMRSENTCSKCKRLLLKGYQNADNNIAYKDIEYGLPSLKEMVDSIIISRDNKN